MENEAFASFLPSLCKQMLSEPLELPDLTTWWCGQPAELEHVLANRGELVLRNAFHRKPLLASSVGAYMASDILPTGNASSGVSASSCPPFPTGQGRTGGHGHR